MSDPTPTPAETSEEHPWREKIESFVASYPTPTPDTAAPDDDIVVQLVAAILRERAAAAKTWGDYLNDARAVLAAARSVAGTAAPFEAGADAHAESYRQGWEQGARARRLACSEGVPCSGTAALTEDPDDDYRDLADAVIAAFNPPDDDVAEFHIIVSAVKRAAEFIAAAPCQCTPGATDPEQLTTPCDRCLALGRRGDRLEER